MKSAIGQYTISIVKIGLLEKMVPLMLVWAYQINLDSVRHAEMLCSNAMVTLGMLDLLCLLSISATSG